MEKLLEQWWRMNSDGRGSVLSCSWFTDCVRFCSKISSWASWSCAECGVAQKFCSIQIVSTFKPTCRLNGLHRSLEIYCRPVADVAVQGAVHPLPHVLSIVYLILVSDVCLRLDRIPSPLPTLGIRMDQNILDSEINLNSIAILSIYPYGFWNHLDFRYPCPWETSRMFSFCFPIKFQRTSVSMWSIFSHFHWRS